MKLKLQKSLKHKVPPPIFWSAVSQIEPVAHNKQGFDSKAWSFKKYIFSNFFFIFWNNYIEKYQICSFDPLISLISFIIFVNFIFIHCKFTWYSSKIVDILWLFQPSPMIEKCPYMLYSTYRLRPTIFWKSKTCLIIER